VDKLPAILYKYRSIKPTTERLLTLGEIWCSRPSEFNDPFECRPVLSFDHSDPKTKAWLDNQMARRGLRNPGKRIGLRAQFKRRFSQPVAAKDIGIAKMLNENGIYSLTADSQSILMWAHYADAHRGVCIGFDTSKWPFYSAWAVRYSVDYPVINRATDSDLDSLKSSVLTKAKSWEYEQEWRVLIRTLNARERQYHEGKLDSASQLILKQRGPGAYLIPKDGVKSVIFGLRMGENEKIKIREWIKIGGCSPQLFQARQHESKFSVEIDPLGTA